MTDPRHCSTATASIWLVGHGAGFPALRQLSVYGEPGWECKPLDGVLLGVRIRTLINTGLRFDARFEFDCYDLNFQRQDEALCMKKPGYLGDLAHTRENRQP